jgi:hypothetical protein
MTATVFEIHIPGPAASEAASAFRNILAEELPEWSATIETAAPQPDRRLDPALAVALVSLVIAVPGAIKDGLDLAERFKLGQRLKALLARLQAAAAQIDIEPGPFLILPGGFAPFPLETASPDQILQAILYPDEGQHER